MFLSEQKNWQMLLPPFILLITTLWMKADGNKTALALESITENTIYHKTVQLPSTLHEYALNKNYCCLHKLQKQSNQNDWHLTQTSRGDCGEQWLVVVENVKYWYRGDFLVSLSYYTDTCELILKQLMWKLCHFVLRQRSEVQISTPKCQTAAFMMRLEQALIVSWKQRQFNIPAAVASFFYTKINWKNNEHKSQGVPKLLHSRVCVTVQQLTACECDRLSAVSIVIQICLEWLSHSFSLCLLLGWTLKPVVVRPVINLTQSLFVFNMNFIAVVLLSWQQHQPSH